MIVLLGIILFGEILGFGKANNVPPPPRVTIAQGTLVGGTGTDIQGGSYYYFKGIPYATPPLGNLRFKAPQPAQRWSGILNATQEGSPCLGRDIMNTYQIIGGENCLFLNIYTKKLPNRCDCNNNLRPVLFWVPGGGFIFGHGGTEFYGPDFLITEDIVIVSINYRLGLLGFLSLEDPSLDVPGNAAFKDQVLALKWVRNNIAEFGGNPQDVTIIGESAGAGSVHLLVLSPLAKGLFTKAVVQSGSALNSWATGTKGVELIAQALNSPSASETTIYNYLKGLSALQIFAIQETVVDTLVPAVHRQFGYVIERNTVGAFLSEEPFNIISSGDYSQIPIIFGYNSVEGMYITLFAVPVNPGQGFYEELIPWYLGYQNGSLQSQQVGREIEQFYFRNQQPTPNDTLIRYNAIGDAYFIYGVYLSAIYHAHFSRAPVYYYKMTVQTELNTGKEVAGITLPGVCHYDDIGYLFKTYITPTIVPGSIEDVSSRRFVKLWTNFVITGNPTPQPQDPLLQVDWNRLSNNNMKALEIGSQLKIVPFPDQDIMNFWNTIYAKSPAGGVLQST